MKNIPLVTFVQRTWMLIIAFIVSNWLALTERHFPMLGKWVMDPEHGGIWVAQTPLENFGPILWVIPFGLMIVIMALLIVHLYYRETIDADTNAGRYLEDWRACSPSQRVLVSTIVRIGIFIGLCILCAGLAKAAAPIPVDQVKRWDTALVHPKHRMALDVQMAVYQRTKWRYENIHAMRPSGVPAPILFCLHYRESDNSFRHHAHEGSTLMRRTRDVPKGRPLTPEPPYTFEQSAEDAYYIYEKPTLDRIDWKSMQAALDKMEAFNGFGYRARGVNAPYLWSGTTIYSGGKYIRDGVFSRTAMDGQLGCAAILKRMMERGIKISFVKP